MKRAEEINCMPKGAQLPPLHDMKGFREWSESPIALELMARLYAKVVAYRRAAEGKESQHEFEAGACEAMESVFRIVSGDKRSIPPSCFTRA